MTKEFLHDKRGLVIDSWDQGMPIIGLIERYGGTADLKILNANKLDEAILSENLSFIIIHNYSFEDKEVLVRAKEQGIHILLIKRNIIPPQQEEEYEKMYKDLAGKGAVIKESNYRYKTANIFLNEVFNKI